MLSLAATRGVEARFSAEPFAAHRPYSVVRGGSAREVFPLATLAALEREGQRDALLAAQASTGELARARALLQGAPDRPAREADLAALELLAGQPLAALEAADRALTKEPRLAQALWNRALALRELELPLTAAAALDAVVALAEPGWTQEAKQKADGLRAQLAERASRSQAFTQAGRAMIEGTGPPLTAEDAAARPGLTRQSFHEALRSAASRREALALAPLAEALDGAVESELARRGAGRRTGLASRRYPGAALDARHLAWRRRPRARPRPRGVRGWRVLVQLALLPAHAHWLPLWLPLWPRPWLPAMERARRASLAVLPAAAATPQGTGGSGRCRRTRVIGRGSRSPAGRVANYHPTAPNRTQPPQTLGQRLTASTPAQGLDTSPRPRRHGCPAAAGPAPAASGAARLTCPAAPAPLRR